MNAKLCAELNASPLVAERGTRFGDGGLEEGALKRIEDLLGFVLPPDFRWLLGNLRDPAGLLFDWEHFSRSDYDRRISWVLDGIIDDTARNNIWLRRWGPRPDDTAARKAIVREDFRSWPKLVPIYGHRFLVAEPPKAGNPVLSIMQTDIIWYGANLAEYLRNEFTPRSRREFAVSEVKDVPVWSDFAEDRADAFEYRGLAPMSLPDVRRGSKKTKPASPARR